MEKEKTGNGEDKGDKRSEPEGRRGQKYHRLQLGIGLALEGKRALMLNVDHKSRIRHYGHMPKEQYERGNISNSQDLSKTNTIILGITR